MEAIPAELKERKKLEWEFFTSLSYLSELYDFEPLKMKDAPYPYNIFLAHRHATRIIKQENPDLRVMIVQKENGSTCLATAKVLDTGHELYYIPIEPLCLLLKSGKRRKTTNLLLSLFAYLHHIGVPYFTESGSYLSYVYELTESFLTDNADDFEPEELEEELRPFKKMKEYGGKLFSRFKHPCHLQKLPERVKNYRPINVMEFQLLEAATEALELFKEYPNENLFRNTLPDPATDLDDCIRSAQYVSFCWSGADRSADTIADYVNSDLQEFSAIEEPMALQLFDQPHEKPRHDLHFEMGVFAVIDRLCSVLYNI